MSSIECYSCHRELLDGEEAWASDWTVLGTKNGEARWWTETRYTCDDCETP